MYESSPKAQQLARSTGAAITITPPGGGPAPGGPGPKRIRIYKIMLSATIASTTTAALITISDSDAAAIMLRVFSTPITATVRGGFEVDFGPFGCLFDTSHLEVGAPGDIVITPAFVGTGGTATDLTVIFDYE